MGHVRLGGPAMMPFWGTVVRRRVNTSKFALRACSCCPAGEDEVYETLSAHLTCNFRELDTSRKDKKLIAML